ncbi:MAG TPA: hypothetical protein PLJ21_02920 [Pseudobdellovibrionaceae bacterium]|nr:hypothetical protein [Pseudobdellovibrionaceae bacterium]
MKSPILALMVTLSLTLTLPGVSNAASLFVPGGAFVQTVRGALLLVPAMSQAKDKDSKPSKDSKKGRSEGSKGMGGRYLDTNRGGSDRAVGSRLNENGGGRWGGSDSGQSGSGGDSYPGLFSVQTAGNLAVGALFLAIDPQALPPIDLQDHLAAYLENQAFLAETENGQQTDKLLAMPTQSPPDLEKIIGASVQRISIAAQKQNQISDFSAEEMNQLKDYLASQGFDINDAGNKIVGLVNLDTVTVAALSKDVPELAPYLKALILTNE